MGGVGGDVGVNIVPESASEARHSQVVGLPKEEAQGAGELSERCGREALEDLAAFRIERYPHHPIFQRIWALRANATAYDACYLALAEALDTPLVTRDRRLAGVPGHGARVEVVGVSALASTSAHAQLSASIAEK